MKTNTCILTAYLVSVCEDYLLTAGRGAQGNLARYIEADADLDGFRKFSKAHDTWDPGCHDWFESKATLALFLLEAHDSEVEELEAVHRAVIA